ncbi:MAG: NADH-quinone oxidoreductase subunit J family protein [Actinomycetota bacterium]
MVAQNVAFGILAAAMVISAIGVVTTKNVVHAALFLVVVLAGGAAQFILLGQAFVAWVQVLVYIGAVIVLFLFGIMLTRAPMHPEESLGNDLKLWGLGASLLLVGVLSALMIRAFDDVEIVLDRPTRTSEVTGAVFRTYIIPFEVVGLLLLAALVGAVVLARKD